MSGFNFKKRNVTVYTVRFEGMFGRNRKSKSHYGSQTVAEKDLPEDALVALAQKELLEIGAKKGKVSVIKYAKVEETTSTYDGKDVTTLSIPIFDGVTVLKLEV